MDDPLEIFNTAADLHTEMINQMKGVPGVTQERLVEGLSARYCALSLVGKPIMYLEISMFLDELQKRRISTFLVTNMLQQKIARRQLIGHSLGTSGKRFIDSLTALKEKQQQTVYRLTVVKGWNREDVDVKSIGKPNILWIGSLLLSHDDLFYSSATSKLTVQNVSWHSNVKVFLEALTLKSEGEYEGLCEHAHSCSVLSKTRKFKVSVLSYTWLVTASVLSFGVYLESSFFLGFKHRFSLMVQVASGRPFNCEDYMALTPSGAIYGAEESRYYPNQSWYRKK
ncbi:S-adenosyl-L-methionine-dependent tRNA 4-demethylwyosine synthase [Gossypium australe]|uniref:S-adenosyl-L-methionine-dependent tRNA 4-demethylwyosine synthase n=1 Tax=Gossypium australe TaxID=47621 RepID=A0A5B6X3Y4_9ROSI|nr:S-adenosyl-L-methionine-dependent tRNA 4-demethylwyosine synthase [Gossypium australe]